MAKNGKPDLTPKLEEAFCRVISERTGILVQDSQLAFLRASVQGACQKFGYGDARQYLDALRSGSETSRELEYLIADITVGESYFFRDVEQIEFLRENYLPALIDSKRRAGSQMLRIWSAGCSAGQELYSIAILLEELLADIDQWTIHLLGTDINTASLRRAIAGHYSAWSLRATSTEKRAQYFKPLDQGAFELLPRIRQRARFTYQNLGEDSFPSVLSETNAQDLILCRNVLMYMGPNTIVSIMKKFTASLVPDGILLLGACDPHPEAPRGLVPKRTGNIHCYVANPIQAGNDVTPGKTVPVTASSGAASAKQRSVDSARAHFRAQRIRQPATSIGAQPFDDDPKARATAGQPHPRVKSLLSEQRWDDAVQAIDDIIQKGGDSPLLLQLKANALANLGNLGASVELCERSQAGDPDDKHSYLIQAMALQGLGRVPEAEKALRKSLYLDHEFVEAHYQLALLLFSAGRMPDGMKSLKNAMQLAERGDPDRKIHDAPGMTYGRLAEVLRNEYDIYCGLTGIT